MRTVRFLSLSFRTVALLTVVIGMLSAALALTQSQNPIASRNATWDYSALA